MHLERADGLLKKGGRGHSPALTPALVARLASAEPGTIVIGADSLRVDHPVVKAVEGAGGLVVRCRRLWDTPPPWDADPRRAELVQWLLTEARGRGVALTPDEALYVTAATGNDLAALLDRLEDLRHRGRAAVGEVVGWDAGGSPWELAERLVDGDVRRGAPGVEALFRSGFRERDGSRRLEPATLTALLVGALSGKVREAALGAAALAGGGAPAAAAALAGVKGPPRALEAYRARLGRRPAGDWRRMQLEVADLERRSKSGALVDASDFALLALRWTLRR